MRTIGVGVKIAISLLALTSFSVLLSNYPVYAEESSVSTATVTINQSCSMSGTTNTAHTATLANGTYSGTNYPNGIGQTTLKVFCNDNAGFAIYAIGYTGNEYGNTKLHNDTLGTNYDISTGTYTSGTTANSTWSMKLTSVSGTYAPTIADGTNNTENFTTWHTIPTEYTKVAYRTSTTDADNNGQGTGSSLTTTYDAYVSATQPAGTYIGQVKYTLVHPNMTNNANRPGPLAPTLCPQDSICYVPNASDVEGSMSSLGTTSDLANVSTKAGKVSATSNNEKVLVAPNFSRPGYGFAGWSTDFEATSNSIIYGPNETITVPDVSENGLILYPVWIASAGNLQGADGQGWTGCSSLTPATYNNTTGKVEATLSSVTALKDTRDNNVYAVARLADGKCWMVENLRLNAENSRGDANAAKAQGYGDATANNLGKFIGLADSEDTNFTASTTSATDPTTANSIYYAGTQSGTATIDIFQTNYAGFRMPRYNNNNTNMATGATNSDGTTALTDSYNANNNHVRWYGYGNYYSWPAAFANTKSYTTYSGTNGSDAAGTSICPKGWKLPLGYTSTGTINGSLQDEANDSANRVGGFSYLDRKLGGTGTTQLSTAGEVQSVKWRSFPNNFVCSGYFYDSSASNRNSYGYYWSSSSHGNYYAYYLYLGNSGVRTGNNSNGKSLGQSVRCIAQ